MVLHLPADCGDVTNTLPLALSLDRLLARGHPHRQHRLRSTDVDRDPPSFSWLELLAVLAGGLDVQLGLQTSDAQLEVLLQHLEPILDLHGRPPKSKRGGNLDAADVEPEAHDRRLFLDCGGPLPRYLVWVARPAVRWSMSVFPQCPHDCPPPWPLPPPLNPLHLPFVSSRPLPLDFPFGGVAHWFARCSKPPHLKHFISSATAPTSVSSASWPYSSSS